MRCIYASGAFEVVSKVSDLVFSDLFVLMSLLFFDKYLPFDVCSLPFVPFYCRLTQILQFSHLFAIL